MKKIIVLLVLIVSIPAVIINFFYSYKKIKNETGFINKKKETIRILKEDNTIEEIDLEDYLIGVVSGEMPTYFEDEALKAQAVASRTYALKQKQNNVDENYDLTTTTSSQVYKTKEELKKIWGDNYNKNINKIENAVKATEGEYISYNNNPIYAFFFSTSNGYTENNKNVFGEDLPYLKSVDSSFDLKENDNSIVTKKIKKDEFYSLLNINYSDNLNISEINKSETGRILSLKINNNYFKGRDFQKKLSLRSNDFDLKEEDNMIIITTKGFGHGVGMSQYGANSLAKQKKTYIDIIKYYYSDIDIRKL